MKICTVVGARPQFIKAAALSRILRTKHTEIMVHTGQHYDPNMSEVFFTQLAIPTPDYHLGIHGGGHGKMTGEMLVALERVFQKETPDMVLVYGDTNSTLAGALSAVKLHIPVCHVEAGVRMDTLLNPEEVNRILTDRISRLLLCCTSTAVDNLKKEAIREGVYVTGDLMYDAVLYYGKNLDSPKLGDIQDLYGNPLSLPKDYYLMTCHREENTGSELPLKEILSAMNTLDAPTVYPVHPRNRDMAINLANSYPQIILTQPVGYLTSLYLIQHAKKVVTDSGGLQREAWFLGKQCVTLLETPPWPETLDGEINQLCTPQYQDILNKLSVLPDFSKKENQFGDGNAAQKITEILTTYEKRESR